MKKLVSLFLIFSLLALSGNLFAKERRGAKLKIQKKDGQRISGELIAVKESSLLLLESESGADVSIDIKDIKVIKIVKKSKVLLGFLCGMAVGSLFGNLVTQDTSSGFGPDFSGMGFWLAFTLIGLGAGLEAGIDETIKIEEGLFEEKPPHKIKMVNGKPQYIRKDTELEKILKKLRSEARIPDYK